MGQLVYERGKAVGYLAESVGCRRGKRDTVKLGFQPRDDARGDLCRSSAENYWNSHLVEQLK
jgi:hypothetical protein